MDGTRVTLKLDLDTREAQNELQRISERAAEKFTVTLGVKDDQFQKVVGEFKAALSDLNNQQILLAIDDEKVRNQMKSLKTQLSRDADAIKADLTTKLKGLTSETATSSLMKDILGTDEFSSDEKELKKQLNEMMQYINKTVNDLGTIKPVKLFGDDALDMSGYDNQIAAIEKIFQIKRKMEQASKSLGSDFFSSIWNINDSDLSGLKSALEGNAVKDYFASLNKELTDIEKRIASQKAQLMSALSSDRIAGSSGTTDAYYETLLEQERKNISAYEKEMESLIKKANKYKDLLGNVTEESVASAYETFSDYDGESDEPYKNFLAQMSVFIKQAEQLGQALPKNAYFKDMLDIYNYESNSKTSVLNPINESIEAAQRLVELESLMAGSQERLRGYLSESALGTEQQTLEIDFDATYIQNRLEAIIQSVSASPEITFEGETLQASLKAIIEGVQASPDIVPGEELGTRIQEAIRAVNASPDFSELKNTLDTLLNNVKVKPEIDYGSTSKEDFFDGSSFEQRLSSFEKFRSMIKEYESMLVKLNNFESKGYNLPTANNQQQTWYSNLVAKIAEAERELSLFKATYESVTLTMKDGSTEVIPVSNLQESLHHYKQIEDIVFNLKQYAKHGITIDINEESVQASISSAVANRAYTATIFADPSALSKSINAILDQGYKIPITPSVESKQVGKMDSYAYSIGKINEQLELKNNLTVEGFELTTEAFAEEIKLAKQLATELKPLVDILQKITKNTENGDSKKGNGSSKKPSNNNSQVRGGTSLPKLVENIAKQWDNLQNTELLDRTSLNEIEDDVMKIIDIAEKLKSDPLYIQKMSKNVKNLLRPELERINEILIQAGENANRAYIKGKKNIKDISSLNGNGDAIDAAMINEANNLASGRKNASIKRRASGYDVSFLNEQTNMVEKYRLSLDSTGKAILQNKISEEEYISTGKKLISSFKNKILQITQYVSGINLIYKALDKVKEGIEVVREMDAAMTELKKVTDEASVTYENFPKIASDIAKEVGSTSKEIVNATADWARMGYSLKEAQELAKTSAMYVNVGDGISMDTANESLISTLQGFQLKADDSLSIVDKFNEVANKFAIDSNGIGQALQRSAASFNAANTDISSSIALITATNEIVQDPEKVGNMWKTKFYCLNAQQCA